MSSSVPNTPLIVSPQPHDDATSDHNRSPSLPPPPPPPPSSISSLLNVTSKSTDDPNQDPVSSNSPSPTTTTNTNTNTNTHCGATDQQQQQQRKRPFSALENNDDLTITTNTNDSTSSKEHGMDTSSTQGDTSNQQQSSSSSSSSSSWPGNHHQQQQQQQSHHLPTPVSPAAPMPHQNKIAKMDTDERQPSMSTSESGSVIKEEYHMVQRTKADTPGGMYTSFSLKQTNASNHGTGASTASSSSSSNKARGSRDNGSVSKPYTCSECDQTFSRAHNLKSHTATHSMERPYKVNECRIWD